MVKTYIQLCDCLGVLDATDRGRQPVPADLREADLLQRRTLPDIPRGRARLEAADTVHQDVGRGTVRVPGLN